MIFSIYRILAGVFIVLFCVQSSQAFTLKIATLSPEGSMWMEKMREGADQVTKQTHNRVVFKFYPGGVMGNDSAVLRKIRIGQLHGGAVVGGSLSQFFPANQLYAQPMKFKSLEEIDYVRKHMDSFIINGLDNAGFVTFGLIGGGFAYIMSQEPIETVENLRSQKVWIPDNDKISQDSIKAFGIAPIPLPIADVRTALQSGLINTVGTSPYGALILQWHTQIKYVTNIPLIYLHAVLAIEKNSFLKISPEDQKIVSQIMTRAMHEIDTQNRLDDIIAIETLKKRGIVFINPSKEARAEWYRVADAASEEMIRSGVLPKKVADRLDALLDEFHSKTKTVSQSQK
ncbi:MAG: TRAP transporter substrate-binding protein DctP [Proteobacteria bacterium]|nr:TRAP transporter substrate-binding protein DctP [Pseudomonadota bacterium]MBU1390058.1 TRAP transporter substrate-binding protein DctP [Pseudomonadota bacterium]MBU1544991.1 TRAP transporter substrate-binding protein DctP [Pseudomonadota bacterium]MBU2430557.1 TRAP transporter substrate-binding protein DctP [Pseudomonadota bacterium]MBU2480973.1 TRAP transporter substrate-binding protein DctP [Pseudomonadota bacterium]